ncbi:unnamed protein product [Prunus armeniaca]|uniref:CCHC-type domain-containing protein n=1 Tax=Prunus armeniaca TaxID=36596 RepID=A0A6J5VLG3_PRUAR|nr:unnamed protein product [Prunus armeniaca]
MANINEFVQCSVGKFDGQGNFQYWDSQMEFFFKVMEYTDVMINGFTDPGDQATLTQNQREEMVKNWKKDSRALMYIFVAIDPAIYEKIAHVSTSKEAWDVLINSYIGRDKEKNDSKNEESSYEVRSNAKNHNSNYKMVHNRFENKRGRGRSNTWSKAHDKSNVPCFKCWKYGHYKNECNSQRFENKGHHAKVAKDDKGNEEICCWLIMLSVTMRKTSGCWILDTGCSNHMCGHKDLFSDLNDLRHNFLSLEQLSKKGYDIWLLNGVCTISDASHELIAKSGLPPSESLTATRAPRHPKCVVHMLRLKIHHMCGGIKKLDDAKSTSGYAFHIGSGVISWSSKKQ